MSFVLEIRSGKLSEAGHVWSSGIFHLKQY